MKKSQLKKLPKKLILFWLVINLAYVSFSIFHNHTAHASTSSLEVELKVKERFGTPRVKEPVSYGVPFSKADHLFSTSQFGIFNSSGDQIQAQFRVLSRYEGTIEDTSRPIRMVLVDFQVDEISAHEEQIYTLKRNLGSGTTQGDNLISDDGEFIIIDTGSLTAIINKTRFNLFDEVTLKGRMLIGENDSDGLVIEDKNGVVYTSNNQPTQILIEENGPLKAVVKIKGYFKNEHGEKLIPPLGDNGLSYVVRFKAYKGKSYIKVDYTFENENQAWAYTDKDPIHNIWINSTYLKTTLTNLDEDKSIDFGGEVYPVENQDYSLVQDEVSSGEEAGRYDWNYTIERDFIQVGNGEKFDSYVSLNDTENGLMVASRWFWQNHPTGLDVSPNGCIKFNVLPKMDEPHRVLGGIWKTTELIYYFHEKDNDFNDELGALKKRLIAKASDEYFAQTDFLSALIPENLTSDYEFPAGEKLQSSLDAQKKKNRTYVNVEHSDTGLGESLITLRDARNIKLRDNEYGTWYGWLEFGDFVRGNGWGYSATHYGWPYISLKNFLRFNDYEAFDFAEELISHEADISIMHDPYATENMDQEYHGGHRYEGDALLSYSDTHSHSTNNPRFGSHFWNRGTHLQYLLTGDGRYFDAAQDTAEHFETAYIEHFHCYPDAKDPKLARRAGALRGKGRAVLALIGFYKVSGERKYLDYAWNIFQYAISDGHLMNYTVDNKTYTYPADMFLKYDDPDKDDPEFSALQAGITVEGVIEMHRILTDLGETQKITKLNKYINDLAVFVKEIIYTSWISADCGTYGIGDYDGMYFPYGQKKLWNPSDVWDDNEIGKHKGNYGNFYAMMLADLFSMQFKQTGDIEWLNLARSAFKDFYSYYLSAGFYEIAHEARPVSGFRFFGSAWAKSGQILGKGMYYLNTEWQVANGYLPNPPNPVNHPPVLNPIGNHTLEEEEILEIIISGFDMDDDPLTLDIINKESWMQYTEGLFVLEPQIGDMGIYSVKFILSDGALTDEETVIFTVKSQDVVDDEPPSTPSDLQAVDITDTTIKLAWQASTDNLSLAGYEVYRNGVKIADTPETTFDDGELQPDTEYTYEVLAYDESGNKSGKAKLIVQTKPEQKSQVPPVVQASFKKKNERSPVEVVFSTQGTYDDNNDDLSYSWNFSDGSTSTEPNPTHTFVNPYMWKEKVFTVKLSVTDGTHTIDKTMDITVPPKNKAPEIYVSNQILFENTKKDVYNNFRDRDGDPVIVAIKEIDQYDWMSYQDGKFLLTPGYEDAGEYTVTFTADDGFVQTEKSIEITVLNKNRFPSFNRLGYVGIKERQPYTFSFDATDPDNDEVTINFNGIEDHPWISFDGDTLQCNPGYTHSGTYTFPYTITDGTITFSRKLILKVINVNHKPVLEQIEDIQVKTGESKTITMTAHDEDTDDTLTWFDRVWEPHTQWVKRDGNILTITPGESVRTQRTYSFVVGVRDNHNGVATQRIKIHVTD